MGQLVYVGIGSLDGERDSGEQWRGRSKVVFSRTRPSVDTDRTRLDLRLDLRLGGHHRFGCGVVHLVYDVADRS